MSCDSTILIADDNPDVVQLLRAYVRPLGCEVVSAKDGEEALQIVQRDLPDIVLLDVVMPKKSGWEVCQAIKSVQRTAGIAVVLVTGKGDVKDRLTGLQVGADDYLVKPFDRDEVTKRIGALLDKRKLRKTAVVGSALSEEAMSVLRDPATGLPTVGAVLPRLKEMLIQEGRLGILYIDIEQFELIEAEYGWAFFDEFLRKVGEVILAETNAIDQSVLALSRAAGSSFYVFVKLKGQGSVADELQKINNRLRERLLEELQMRFPSMEQAQIGFFTGAGAIAYEPQLRLERQIYHGMQAAMDAVRNAEQEQKRQLSGELREIIRKKRVTTLFQPIVHAADGAIWGYEILTRGPRQSSFLNSDMLFSFARESNLAWDLESLALESCLKTLRAVDLGERKFLLNLEAEMFAMSDFKFHDMAAYLDERVGNFVLELTERAAIEDYASFRTILEQFRAKGIEIAIDDAGSGYASLEAIASLAPDYLKVTKGLVSTLPTEPIKQDLLKMLVELAKRIGAKTIAEGVETAAEYAWCREVGIDLLQGYYIARPQPEPGRVAAPWPDSDRRAEAR